MKKIRKGDEVIVVAGGSKGMRGTVLSVVASSNRVLVEGVNFVKKHVKPNPQKGVEGGIVEKEAPLQISNVALYNPATEKADRVGFKFLEDGKKVRYFKSNNELVDV
jgi:large subunit ribosomal protein L24